MKIISFLLFPSVFFKTNAVSPILCVVSACHNGQFAEGNLYLSRPAVWSLCYQTMDSIIFPNDLINFGNMKTPIAA